MRYAIYLDGEPVNTIVADEAFVAAYCERNGYSYVEDPLFGPEADPVTVEEVTTAEMAAAILEGVNEV